VIEEEEEKLSESREEREVKFVWGDNRGQSSQSARKSILLSGREKGPTLVRKYLVGTTAQRGHSAKKSKPRGGL